MIAHPREPKPLHFIEGPRLCQVMSGGSLRNQRAYDRRYRHKALPSDVGPEGRAKRAKEEHRDQRSLAAEIAYCLDREEPESYLAWLAAVDCGDLPFPRTPLFPHVIYVPDEETFSPACHLLIPKLAEYLEALADMKIETIVMLVSVEERLDGWQPYNYGWIGVGEIYPNRLGFLGKFGEHGSWVRALKISELHSPWEMPDLAFRSGPRR